MTKMEEIINNKKSVTIWFFTPIINFVSYLKFPNSNPIEKTNSFKQDILLFLFFYFIFAVYTIIKLIINGVDFSSNFEVLVPEDTNFLTEVFLVPFIMQFASFGFFNFNRKYIFVLAMLFYVLLSFTFDTLIIGYIVLALVIIISLVVFFRKNVYVLILDFIQNNKKYLILISPILFVYFGIDFTHTLHSNLFFLIRAIVFGFLFTYITIKYNIWYSIVFQSIISAIPFVMVGLLNDY